MSQLNVSLVIRAVNRTNAAVRGVTSGLGRIRNAAVRARSTFATAARAQSAFATAGNLSLAAQNVNAFAAKARGALAQPTSAFEAFEAEMSRVKGLTKTTGSEFESLKSKALELGGSIGEFSALDVAKGMSDFGIAGYSTTQIMAALPTALDLSTAAGVELNRTIDITTGIMGAFGLGAGETGRVGDVLTATFTGTKTTLETLGETMKYVGPVAKMMGVSLEETAAFAGILGAASIDASQAGTTLRAMLTSLAAPRRRGQNVLEGLKIDITEFIDGTRRMRKPLAILEDFREAVSKFDTAKRARAIKFVFGQEALAGVSQVLENIDGTALRKIQSDIAGASGGLDIMAAIMRDNAANTTKELVSAADTLQITLGEQLKPALGAIKTMLRDMAIGLNNWAKENPSLARGIMITVGVVALLATVLGGTLVVASAAVSAYGILAGGMAAISTAATVAIPAVIGFAGTMASAATATIAATWPILAIVAAVALVATGIYLLITRWRRLVAWFDALSPAGKTVVKVLLAVSGPIGWLIAAAYRITKHWKPIKSFFLDLWESVTRWANKAVAAIEPLIAKASAVAKLVGSGVASLLGGDENATPAVSRVKAPELQRYAPIFAEPKESVSGAASKQSEAPAGRLHIQIDSEGRPKVQELSAEGFNLEVDAGMAMVTL